MQINPLSDRCSFFKCAIIYNSIIYKKVIYKEKKQQLSSVSHFIFEFG